MAKKSIIKTPGRPTKYNNEFPGKVIEMVGLTHADMAKNLGIGYSTFYAHKEKYQEFSNAIKEADDKTDNIVQSALFRRAIGYSHPDVHISNYKGDITKTEIKKHYPPDSTALIFWLKNRRPEEWRDKHEISGELGFHPVQSKMDELTEEQLIAMPIATPY